MENNTNKGINTETVHEWAVYQKAGTVKIPLITGLTEDEALKTAESLGWVYIDENEFEWNLYVDIVVEAIYEAEWAGTDTDFLHRAICAKCDERFVGTYCDFRFGFMFDGFIDMKTKKLVYAYSSFKEGKIQYVEDVDQTLVDKAVEEIKQEREETKKARKNRTPSLVEDDLPF